MKLTNGEYNTLLTLSVNDDVSGVLFKSKTSLRILALLDDKGLIDFQPFCGTAELTEAGRAALKEHRNA